MATKINFDAEQRLVAHAVTAEPRAEGRKDVRPARLEAAKCDVRDEDSSQSPARYPGFVRVGIALGGAAACWAIVAGLIVAVN